MAAWQIIVLAFFVLTPFSLLFDFWPYRERCNANGRPLPREWRPAVQRLETAEHH